MLVAGGAAALLGVAAGAFGAHGLEGRVSADDLEIFETAVRYQVWHAVALLAVAPAAARWPDPLWGPAAALFLAGIVVFSGSLYTLVLTGVGWLGAVTPLGGLSFLSGWACAVVAAWRGVG
jgi:uncharacterized membrane protein YgdD (TMEM256/DUF423 family)